MTNHTALLPVEQIDKDLADLIMMMDQLPYDRARDWLVTKLAAHRLQAPAEAGEEVERVDGSTNLPIRLEGRARFLEDRGEVKTPGLLREAITAFRANAPEGQGEVERLRVALEALADSADSVGDLCNTTLMDDAIAKARAALASGAGDEG